MLLSAKSFKGYGTRPFSCPGINVCKFTPQIYGANDTSVRTLNSKFVPQRLYNFSHTTMDSDEMFNWPDGDAILHATHPTDSRDFRVHKFFLSFASSVFNDMFKHSQPSSVSPNIDIIDVVDPPRVLELTLRFIYPCTWPTINNLAILSEVLILADKYDIETARSRLRPSLVEFAKTEPLRVYMIWCRLRFEDEMKITPLRTTSIDLPDLAQLPDEFGFIPATEYYRLVHLHRRYRRGVVAIRCRLSWSRSTGRFLLCRTRRHQH